MSASSPAWRSQPHGGWRYRPRRVFQISLKTVGGSVSQTMSGEHPCAVFAAELVAVVHRCTDVPLGGCAWSAPRYTSSVPAIVFEKYSTPTSSSTVTVISTISASSSTKPAYPSSALS